MGQPQLWVIRAGVGGHDAESFEQESLVGVAMPPVAGLTATPHADARVRIMHALKASAGHDGPSAADESRAQLYAAMLLRFVFEVEIQDRVVTTDADGDFLLGVVVGPYELHHDPPVPGYYHLRQVRWVGSLRPRDVPPKALASLRAPQSVYRPGAEALLLALPQWSP